MPIYRVIALKKEEKEREDLEKRDKDEVKVMIVSQAGERIE